MELTIKREALLRRAIRIWEAPRHWGQVMEECAELIVAIRHRDRGRVRGSAVAEEIADVMIVAEKARLMVGTELVDSFIEKKLARFEERIVHEEERRGAGLDPKDP